MRPQAILCPWSFAREHEDYTLGNGRLQAFFTDFSFFICGFRMDGLNYRHGTFFRRRDLPGDLLRALKRAFIPVSSYYIYDRARKIFPSVKKEMGRLFGAARKGGKIMKRTPSLSRHQRNSIRSSEKRLVNNRSSGSGGSAAQRTTFTRWVSPAFCTGTAGPESLFPSSQVPFSAPRVTSIS